MVISGIRTRLIQDSDIAALVPANRVYISMAEREARRPYIVCYRIDAPPAGVTLDGSSALKDGLFQFDCFADTQIDAEKLAKIVEASLEDYGGSLPDGSDIQFIETQNCGDDAYEIGGSSFVFRSVLRMKAFFTEA